MAIAGSIIFHHFALWAGYKEHSREGYKYELEKDYKTDENKTVVTYIDYSNENGEMISSNQTERIREQRAKKKEQESEIGMGVFEEDDN